MKLPVSLSALMALAVAPAFATEVVIVNWNQSWDYCHPMGLDPALADPDFNATWFLKPADFAATYNGPAFGGPKVIGNAGNTASFDSGTGPGPFGYGAIDYFSSAGALMTAFGTTLTTPTAKYTAYFRTTFTTTESYTSPRIRMLLDDGALVYLDGALVARVNKADNSESYAAMAADTTATLNETGASAGNETCIQSFGLGVAGAGTQADSFVTVPVSSLAPGEHTLAVSARSNATSSSDLGIGLQLLGDNAGILATATNVQRQDNGPGFADDTFTFDVMVTASNLPGAVSFTSSNPAEAGPVAGFYGNTYSYTYPAQVDIGTLTTATIKYTDENDPLLTTTLTVIAPAAPAGAPLVISAATPSHGTGFEETSMGGSSFSRRNFHTELSFTATGAAVVQDALANGTGSKMLRFAGGAASLTTEAVGVDPAVKGIQAKVTLRTYTDTTTGFEFDDSLRIIVEGSPDGVTWTDRSSLVPALYGNDPATPLNPAGMDQLLSKLGPGTPGLPSLRSRRGWAAAGYATGPNSDTLTLPDFTVPDASPVRMEFTHRYSFEYDGTRWDGGAIAVSVNGGPFVILPGSAFTENGYAGITITGNNVLKGFEGFNGDSEGYDRGDMLTSVLTIPGVTTGDDCQIQFLGGWDEFSTAGNPNWEISSIKVTSGATVLFSDDFAAGNGNLNATVGWIFDDGTLNAGPPYHQFVRSAIPLGATDQFVRLRLYQPSGVALSTSEFILIDGLKLEAGLDPLADADGDGVSNGLEDLAGTGITDPLSAFRVSTTAGASPDTPGSQRATVNFPTADFRTYRFQSSNDLVSWADLEVRYGDSAAQPLSFIGEAAGPAKFWRLAIGY